ncbi:hypothetical protein ACFY5D_00755 [Paeniglutamicibacter sp. NPDC012692]|uniref:hypothetical protein n=1 Tax=Paeniglutamicibacter sp. NPDC012692 TaxID=3364388 RepID=UPI0036915AAA
MDDLAVRNRLVPEALDPTCHVIVVGISRNDHQCGSEMRGPAALPVPHVLRCRAATVPISTAIDGHFNVKRHRQTDQQAHRHCASAPSLGAIGAPDGLGAPGGSTDAADALFSCRCIR